MLMWWSLSLPAIWKPNSNWADLLTCHPLSTVCSRVVLFYSVPPSVLAVATISFLPIEQQLIVWCSYTVVWSILSWSSTLYVTTGLASVCSLCASTTELHLCPLLTEPADNTFNVCENGKMTHAVNRMFVVFIGWKQCASPSCLHTCYCSMPNSQTGL